MEIFLGNLEWVAFPSKPLGRSLAANQILIDLLPCFQLYQVVHNIIKFYSTFLIDSSLKDGFLQLKQSGFFLLKNTLIWAPNLIWMI